MYKQEEGKTFILFKGERSRGAVMVRSLWQDLLYNQLPMVMLSWLSGCKASADSTNSVLFIKDSLQRV